MLFGPTCAIAQVPEIHPVSRGKEWKTTVTVSRRIMEK